MGMELERGSAENELLTLLSCIPLIYCLESDLSSWSTPANQSFELIPPVGKDNIVICISVASVNKYLDTEYWCSTALQEI